MKACVMIAHGDPLVTLTALFISLPALAGGFICLAAGVVLNLRKPKQTERMQAALVIGGAALLVIAAVAPVLLLFLAKIIHWHL